MLRSLVGSEMCIRDRGVTVGGDMRWAGDVVGGSHLSDVRGEISRGFIAMEDVLRGVTVPSTLYTVRDRQHVIEHGVVEGLLR